MANAKLTKTTEASLEELAAVTGWTKSWLTKLARDGYFRSERHGSYRLCNVIGGLLKHAREANKPPPEAPAMRKYHEARARQVEQRTKRESGELIAFSEALAILDDIIGGMKAALDGLPARCTRDMPMRRTIETELNEILTRVANRLDAEAGGAVDEPKDGDDDETRDDPR